MTEPLWAAVDDLTKPRRVKLLRDDGTADWTELPALWFQLAEAARVSTARDGGGQGFKYRAPVDVDCLELLLTIRDVVVDALHGHDQKPRRDVPASIRALASVVVRVDDDDLTGWWIYRLQSWCRQINHALRLTDEPQPRRYRDTQCTACGATHTRITTPDGVKQRVPALLFDFVDGAFRGLGCSECGRYWYRGGAANDVAAEIAARRHPGRGVISA